MKPSLSHIKKSLLVLTTLILMACSDDSADQKPLIIDENLKSSETFQKQPEEKTLDINYPHLRQQITYGKATYQEVLDALTEKDVGALTNTMHAIYSMRWHRSIVRLLDDLWKLDKTKHPNLAWNLISTPPTRIALASTINRINIFDMQEQKAYIRSHQNDEHEFHRAQVVISLALNGDPVDVPYLKEMANGKNVFVAQTAITGLGIMNNKLASDTLQELYKKYKDDARAEILLEVLDKAYKLKPSNT